MSTESKSACVVEPSKKGRSVSLMKRGLTILAWVIPLAATIYLGVAALKSPSLVFEVLASPNVVDINEDAKNLDIMYGGKSIKASGSTLKVISVRIVNEGRAAIREGDYASTALPGFVVNKGEVIEQPQVVEASNDYLVQNAKLTLNGKNRVLMSPVLLNPGDFITFKLLVLLAGGSDADITPEKSVIAEVDQVRVRRTDNTGRETFFSSVIHGGVLVNVVRLLLSGVIFFVILVISVVIVSCYTDRRHKLHWKKELQFRDEIVEAYKRSGSFTPSPITEYIFSHFHDRGLQGIYFDYWSFRDKGLRRECQDEMKALGILVKTRPEGAKRSRLGPSQDALLQYKTFIHYAEQAYSLSLDEERRKLVLSDALSLTMGHRRRRSRNKKVVNKVDADNSQTSGVSESPQ